MTRRTLALAISTILAVAGILPAQTTQTYNLKVAGVSRSGVVHVPSGVSKPPVVFFVHGYGGNGSGFANDTKADKIADREKFIAVYPSAIGGSWSMYDTADYPFLRALLDSVDRRYVIDRNRVYCAGFSQGGFISFGVGYKHPELFAAVAPVSGHIPSFSTSAPLKRPVPMFLTFGTNDISDVASFMADVNTWLKLDGCDLSTRKFQRPYPASNKSSTVARITYTCSQGSEVMIDSIVGGPHEWAMDTVKKVNTTEEVWAFFKRFTLSGTSSAISGRSIHGIQGVSATFRAGKVRLHGAPGIEVVTVSTLDGRRIATTSVDPEGAFEFQGHPGGVYLVRGSTSEGRFVVRLGTP